MPRFSLRILNLPKKSKEAHLRESTRTSTRNMARLGSRSCEKDDNRVATVSMSERKEIKRAVDATDGRLLFGALIDVYDNSTGENSE